MGLTRAGLCLAVSATTILLVGASTEQILTTTLGGFGIFGLMAAFWSARVAVYGLAHEGCAIEMEADGLLWRGVRGVPMSRDFRVRGEVASTLFRLSLRPGFVGPVTGDCEATEDGWRLTVTAARMGTAWLHGFHVMGEVGLGLVMVRVWRPAPTTLEIVPRRYLAASSSFAGGRIDTARAREQARSSARPGFGLDLRELRDHQPGDPFKHIAWSATARRGRLVSRVFEAHARRSVWLVLDASPSMFWGEVGRAPIDLAMDTAFQVAHALISGGDRVGLILHDDKVRLEIPPGGGRVHLHRLLQGILEAPHLVHEGNVEMTSQEIVVAAAHWFAAQEGVELRLPPALQERGWGGSRQHDAARVTAAARRWLAMNQEGGGRRPVIPWDDYARDPSESMIRAFCRHAGVPLSRVHASRPGGQAMGIEGAIQSVLHARGGPFALLLISDLATTLNVEALRRAALGSRRHHHRIVVVCPEHAPLSETAAEPQDAFEAALAEVDSLRSQQALATVEAFLRPAGVGVVRVGARNSVSEALRGIARVA